MSGQCSQCPGHTGFAPAHSVCAFPVYTAQAPGCSAGKLSKAGPALQALPRSKPSGSGSRVLQKAQTRLGLRFVPFPGRSSSGDQVLGERTLPGGQCVLSPPASQPLSFLGVQWECHLGCAVCLLWGADLWLRPSWQMSTLQDPRKTWLATGSLLAVWWRVPSLGPRLPLAFRLWLPPASLPLKGDGPVNSCWLSSGIRSVLCSASRPGCALELFVGKSPPLSFSPWLSHSLGCYLALAPSDCPQGIQAQSLPYTGSPRLPVQPLLAGGGSSIWATSPLGVAVRCIFCGFFLFPSQLCCPLRFRNSPQTHQWDGFLLFGSFSSFTTPSPRQVSIPDSFVSFLCVLYFVLPPFKENGLPFWVPGVLRQRSEVVLWKLLSIQMIFWWTGWGESCLHHLKTAPQKR